MARRAIRERWPIPPEKRGELMGSLVGIALDDANQPRDVIAATKAILEADKMNMMAESIELDDEQEPTDEQRVKRLSELAVILQDRAERNGNGLETVIR